LSMKRHAALIPLSHDHQHGLAAALRLKRSARAWELDRDRSRADEVLRVAAREFLDFAWRELEAHFDDEEHALLPLLAGYDMDAGIARLLTEHASLRRAIRELESQLRRAAGDSAAIEKVHTSALTVATLLHDHIRWEERELFELAQQALADSDLAEIQLAPRGTEIRDGTASVQALDLRQTDRRDGLAGAMNITPIDLVADEQRPAWAADIEVALIAMRGQLEVTIDGERLSLAAPGVVVVPAGAIRSLRAGSRGALVLSVHTARGPLSIR